LLAVAQLVGMDTVDGEEDGRLVWVQHQYRCTRMRKVCAITDPLNAMGKSIKVFDDAMIGRSL